MYHFNFVEIALWAAKSRGSKVAFRLIVSKATNHYNPSDSFLFFSFSFVALVWRK